MPLFDIPKILPLHRGTSRELNERELKQVWDHSLLHTPDVELAHSLDFSLKKWILYKQEHPEVQQMIDKAHAEGAVNLRRAQFISALQGNVTMQVWLGRHILKQNQEGYAPAGQPAQLADIAPEARQHLIELRNAIYKEKTIEIQLTEVKSESQVLSRPEAVGSGDNAPETTD